MVASPSSISFHDCLVGLALAALDLSLTRFARAGVLKRGALTALCVQRFIVQNHIQQRLVDPDATVVFDEAELAKTVHEKADARAGGADHFRQGFLGDLRNESFRFSCFAKLRHQQQDACQAFFAGVEELVDKVGLDSHAARQQELQEQIGEGMFLVHDADHFRSFDFERCAGGDCRGSRHMQAPHGCERLLADKVAGGQQRDGGFFATLRNDGQSGAPLLQIKNRVGGMSLRKEGLLRLQLDYFSSQTGIRQKCGGVKHRGSSSSAIGIVSSRMPSTPGTIQLEKMPTSVNSGLEAIEAIQTSTTSQRVALLEWSNLCHFAHIFDERASAA